MYATIVRNRLAYERSISGHLGDGKRACRLSDRVNIKRTGLFYRVWCLDGVYDGPRGAFASRCKWERKFLTRKRAIAAAYLHRGYPWKAADLHWEAFDKIRNPDPFWDRGVEPREPRFRSDDCPVYAKVMWCPICTPERDISYAMGNA